MMKIMISGIFLVLALGLSACGESKTSAQGPSDMEKKLVGDWKASDGRGTQIYVGADNKIIVVNENGNKDQLMVDGKTIKAKSWPVTPSLSDDGKTLDWGNGSTWNR